MLTLYQKFKISHCSHQNNNIYDLLMFSRSKEQVFFSAVISTLLALQLFLLKKSSNTHLFQFRVLPLWPEKLYREEIFINMFGNLARVVKSQLRYATRVVE